MEIYSPFELTVDEYRAQQGQKDNLLPNPVSDEVIIAYAKKYLDSYRETINEFFPSFAPHITTYAQYPYETSVLRIGDAGYMMAHKPCETASISVLSLQDLKPPVQTLNIFDIAERFGATWFRADLSAPSFSLEEAQRLGIGEALEDSLRVFWLTLDELTFVWLCRDLLQAEELQPQTEVSLESMPGRRFDAMAKVLLSEPASFKRAEQWIFEFKHWKANRVSANNLLQLEYYLSHGANQIEIAVLMTSGDLTSIGQAVSVRNPRIRIWDRAVLSRLVNKHLEVLTYIFPEYTRAVEQLSVRLAETTGQVGVKQGRAAEFQKRLDNCPPGRKAFSEYEKIATELLEYVFEGALGPPLAQRTTYDGVQRRDVLFKNNRISKFWQTIDQKFGATFLITDFKNYGAPIKASVINDVAKYANKAVGRFILAVSRHGAEPSVTAARIRLFNQTDTIVLVINDAQLMEMVHIKEAGEDPANILDDMLHVFLAQC